MIRTIVTAVAASALVVLGAGVATADVISESTSTESHQATSGEGTSNDAAAHMANSGPGLVEGDAPGHVLVTKLIPILDADGNPVLNANGNPTYRAESHWAPIGNGPAPAAIVHN